MKLGQTILSIRTERNMTQEEFAQIFHVTRQTVSNWEKEKSYPDLQTLVTMSDEFHISLDSMLKEDHQMLQKMNREITWSKKTKKILCVIAMTLVIAITVGAIIWGVVWQRTSKEVEAKFQDGVQQSGFVFDEELGYYKKQVDDNSYYTLSNQKAPGYFDFHIGLRATQLQYNSVVAGENIFIVWNDSDETEEIEYSIDILDENGDIESMLSKKQEAKLLESNPELSKIIETGRKIYKSVY